jgi:hypothetical protein
VLSAARYSLVAQMWPQCARRSRAWEARSATWRPATALRLSGPYFVRCGRTPQRDHGHEPQFPHKVGRPTSEREGVGALAVIRDFNGIIERYEISLHAGKGDFVVPAGCELVLYFTNSSLPSGQPVTRAFIWFNDDFEPEPGKVVVGETSASLEMSFPMSALNTYLSVLDSGKRLDFTADYEPDGGRLLRFRVYAGFPEDAIARLSTDPSSLARHPHGSP